MDKITILKENKMNTERIQNIKLSDNFTLYEMTITQHRQYLKKNLVQSLRYIETGKLLCQKLLQPIRTFYTSPLIINSGFRCHKLNGAVKGSKKSRHLFFEAADFYVCGHSLEKIFRWIWKESNLLWGQLILEPGESPRWIHLSLPNKDRELGQQVYIWEEQKNKYIRYA